VQELRRLGRNAGAYHGETINISEVLADCVACVKKPGWETESIPAHPGFDLLTIHRLADRPTARRVYLSAGIHGDEPAGPLAVKALLLENAFPPHFEVWICPCLNPTGFTQNRRENLQGTDLNRQYLEPHAREIIAHIAWLERQPRFDLCICLHEDWESHGFYLYELNPDGLPAMADPIIDAVSQVCPIDLSDVIEGRPAQRGVIRPSWDPSARPQWPEAFFLLTHKTRLSYTLEAPSDFPLKVRVNALAKAVKQALKCLESEADTL
jgi:hypothetical protein